MYKRQDRSTAGNIIVNIRTSQANGRGPSNSGPGGLRGSLISSPYEDPLTNQNPTEGKRQIEVQMAQLKSKKIDDELICDSKEPQIAATTEIGTRTL